MNKNDATYVADAIRNEIIVLLTNAGYKEAGEYVSQKFAANHCRSVAKDMADD